MIKIFILFTFFIGIFYNYRLKINNIVSVKKKSILMVSIMLFGLVAIYLCYRYDNTFLGYAIAILVIIYLYTVAFFAGITNAGINIFLGTTTILKNVNISDIKNIEYTENGSKEIELKIDAYDSSFTQIYDCKDKTKIIDLLERFKI